MVVIMSINSPDSYVNSDTKVSYLVTYLHNVCGFLPTVIIKGNLKYQKLVKIGLTLCHPRL